MTAGLTHNLSLAEMDKQSFLHPVTSTADHQKNGPHIVKSGSGVTLAGGSPPQARATASRLRRTGGKTASGLPRRSRSALRCA